jgi:hypothetical protein
MTDEQKQPWSELSPDEGRAVRRTDHSTIFSRDEVRRALEILLMPSEEIPTVLDELYADEAEGAGSTFFYGDLLTALSLVSPSAAERAQSLSSETPAETDERMVAFRKTYLGGQS